MFRKAIYIYIYCQGLVVRRHRRTIYTILSGAHDSSRVSTFVWTPQPTMNAPLIGNLPLTRSVFPWWRCWWCQPDLVKKVLLLSNLCWEWTKTRNVLIWVLATFGFRWLVSNASLTIWVESRVFWLKRVPFMYVFVVLRGHPGYIPGFRRWVWGTLVGWHWNPHDIFVP